ncbi:MAG TPA: SDR family NAD(P)-dependent oxidoreductase [Blastocatellia bacterium]|nr:SDR family NAD(P)-dependent oxidoreductase [Blastocatellia bacterium]
MKQIFQDQVAVITGGANGIGFAIAQNLAQQSAQVVLLDVQKTAVQRAARQIGPQASALVLDVTNESQVAQTFAKIAKKFGRIDILVNSAGTTGTTNVKTHEVEFENFQFVFAVNVNGCFLTSRAVLPHMLKRNYGRILHIASIAGKEGNAGMLAYSASKAAVIGMTKVQGKEYAETGITVNALAPAVIRTAMVAALPDEQVKYMTDKIPMKRCGTLEEIAALAAYILSPQASFTTGFTFDMTGGRATY